MAHGKFPMASNFSTEFSDLGRGTYPSGQQDDILDLDAIIEQLGELESQLSYRESEIQATSDASRIAEKSVQLDRELTSVLQELSNLESSDNYSKSGLSYGSIQPYSSNLDDGDILDSSYPAIDNTPPSFHNSESKNSFGTVSSQSSQSSSASADSGKSARTLVRVYSTDGSCKTVAVDDQTTVGKVCEVLIRKNRVAMPLNWSIVEQLPALHMERILEDHLLVLDQLNLWTKDSNNRLIFAERPEKYSIFNDPELKDAVAAGSFSPSVNGFLHLRLDGKKTWKKVYFVLRASGVFYNPKGKGKSASDLVCLQPLQGFDFYFGLDWKKHYKSPTEFGFALKMPVVQKDVPKFIRFFCVEDKKILMDWVTEFRLVKHGCQLHDSFVRIRSWITSEKHEHLQKAKSHDHLVDDHHTPGYQEPSDGSFLSDGMMSWDSESNAVFTHSRKNSTEYGMSKKSIPNLPITTSLTRHLSMHHQNLARTLPRSFARSVMPGSEEDDSLKLPSNNGNFTKFPGPEFGLGRQEIGIRNKFLDLSSTLPRKSLNGMPVHATQSVRSQRTPDKYATLNTRPVCKDQSPDFRSAGDDKLPTVIPNSQSSIFGFSSQPSSDVKLQLSESFIQKMSDSLESVFDSYGFLASAPVVMNCQDIPLPPPPPPSMMHPVGNDVAFDQNLPLPPPPPELMSVNFDSSSNYSQHRQQFDSCFLTYGNKQERHQTSSCIPSTPPAPPVRSAETQLSVHSVNPRAQYVVRDLDRVMAQKTDQGADGLANLEIPLPPPPSFDGDYLDLDLCDLPPPPAEILESIKSMRNRPLPPVPTNGPPPLHRPMFSKVI